MDVPHLADNKLGYMYWAGCIHQLAFANQWKPCQITGKIDRREEEEKQKISPKLHHTAETKTNS